MILWHLPISLKESPVGGGIFFGVYLKNLMRRALHVTMATRLALLAPRVEVPHRVALMIVQGKRMGTATAMS